MKRMQLVPLACAVVLAACSDVPNPAEPVSTHGAAVLAASQDAERFVAIGTSISMGWASNGVYAASQQESWPAKLGFGPRHSITLPLIDAPGCTSPIVAPLGAGVRLSGESISGSSVCAPNGAGVTLPTQNVGLAGALAVDALLTTSEAGAARFPWYARVLPPGTTQLTAALSQRPTMISVELGGNEVLNATSGLVVPGVTFAPLPYFVQPFDALVNVIASTNAKVLLFGMPTDATNLPSLRRGDEIWADRAEFAALHVDVSADCDGNPNYINVSIKSLNEVFTGAFTAAHGYPNPVFSCADVPGTIDYVLTPSDIATLNTLLGQMADHVRDQATQRGYAFASLGALYDRPHLKPDVYSVIKQLTSDAPYGDFVSLDGVHPSATGNNILAAAAAQALHSTYGGDIASARSVASVFGTRTSRTVSPTQARQLAVRLAKQHAGERLPACPITGDCQLHLRSMAR